MRLNQASDFALRILMLLARAETPMTVETISKELNLVKSHVMKIIARLAKTGVLTSHRGRNGGVELGRDASKIRIGDVVRAVESDFAIVECMQSGPSDCVFAPSCRLKGLMHEAGQAFLATLDQRTLKSIVEPE